MRRVLSLAVVVATASLVVVPAAAGWVWPADGPVLRPFSLAEDEYAAGQHRGLDIAAATGADVRAPASGTVTFSGSVPGGGRALTIQTSDGLAVTLLQLASVAVPRGAGVAEGAVVGTVGASEDAVTAAPHVHLGIRVATEPNGYVDPARLLPARAVDSGSRARGPQRLPNRRRRPSWSPSRPRPRSSRPARPLRLHPSQRPPRSYRLAR